MCLLCGWRQTVVAVVAQSDVVSRSSYEPSNIELVLFAWLSQLVLNALFDVHLAEVCLDFLPVKQVVFSASFPLDNIVVLVHVLPLDDTLELEPLVLATDLVEGDLREPVVAFGPLHLKASSAVVLVGIPVTDEVVGAHQPNLFAELSVVLHFYQQLLEADVDILGFRLWGLEGLSHRLDRLVLLLGLLRDLLEHLLPRSHSLLELLRR